MYRIYEWTAPRFYTEIVDQQTDDGVAAEAAVRTLALTYPSRYFVLIDQEVVAGTHTALVRWP